MPLRTRLSSLLALAVLAACGNDNNDDFQAPGDDAGDDAEVSTGEVGTDTEVTDGPDVADEEAEPRCGDGVASEGEACDGDDLVGATCENSGFPLGGILACGDDCTLDTSGCETEPDPECGNGEIEEGEECDGDDLGSRICSDFGHDYGRLSCTGSCTIDSSACGDVPVCGDGIADGEAECDDGNTDDGDGCDSQCVIEFCGDGIVQAALGEECDLGNAVTVECDDLPERPYGVVFCEATCAFGEQLCPAAARCGNGELDLGEACDDGNTSDGDGCDSACESETCGNGLLDEGEACDGAALGGRACSDIDGFAGTLTCAIGCFPDISGCRPIVCGDGLVDGAESCDDGNHRDGDGCNRRCAWEACGDGEVTGTEECDDGNDDDFDGCTSCVRDDCTADDHCDDEDPCTTDTCARGACDHGAAAPDTACDDGDACSSGDVCGATGACRGIARDCSEWDSSCSTGICLADTGECFPAPFADDTGCDDGNACTQDDSCQSGVCTPAATTDCSSLDSPCQSGLCNTATGECELVNADDGVLCEDDSGCTINEVCSGGECTAGARIDCSSLDGECSTGVCNDGTGACEAVPAREGLDCDDGDLCTTGDLCASGDCSAGGPVDCSAWDSQCTVGACDGASGSCYADPVDDATSCSDGFDCTVGDACLAGDCVSGAPDEMLCTDSNVCALGWCDPSDIDANPVTGCVAGGFEAGGTLCSTDPMLTCSTGEVAECTCGNGALDGMEECDDGNFATDDQCDDACAIIPCPTTPIDLADYEDLLYDGGRRWYVEGSTVESGNNFEGSCQTDDGNDVLFALTVPIAGALFVDSDVAETGGQDTVLYLLDACPNGSELACEEWGNESESASIPSFPVTPGQVVYIVLDSGADRNGGTCGEGLMYGLDVTVTPWAGPGEPCSFGRASGAGQGTCDPALDLVCSWQSYTCEPISCGDGYCNGDETCETCSWDCGLCPACGNEYCDGDETCDTCSVDCGACPLCGDAVCEWPEDCETCSADCGACSYCGDETCDFNESCETCAEDCGACPVCGDGTCAAGPNNWEYCWECREDCGVCYGYCGDSICDEISGESCDGCPGDCGVCGGYCGDSICDLAGGESCVNCTGDCGDCVGTCGDGTCTSTEGEDCESCRIDCGRCGAYCGDCVCDPELLEDDCRCPSDCHGQICID